MSFHFDPDTHTYTLDGRKLENITQILAPLLPTEFYTEEGRERGRLVHAIIAEYESMPDNDHDGYFMAWQKFCEEHDPRIFLQEEPLYHPDLLYAGTPDIFGNLAGLGDTVIEIKTGAAHPVTALQTAAQAELIKANRGGKPQSRIGVYLRADGGYSVHQYKGHSDWSVFKAMLSVHRWKARHNIR